MASTAEAACERPQEIGKCVGLSFGEGLFDADDRADSQV
jgi:hypothetical protein